MPDESRSNGRTTHRALIIWLLILVAAFIQVRITFRQFDMVVLVTAFDLVVPAITLFALLRQWVQRPSGRSFMYFMLIPIAILGHSIWIFISISEINDAALIKDTAKALSLVILFGCLIVLFSMAELRRPSEQMVFGLLAVVIIPLVLISMYEPFFIARTTQAVGLLGLVFLMIQGGDWSLSTRQRIFLSVVSLLVCCACFLLKSKTSAGTAAVFTLWFAFAPSITQPPRAQFLRIVWVGLAIAGAIWLIFYLADAIPARSFYIASLEQSVEVRTRLWQVTFAAFQNSFPVGLGLGQLTAVLWENNSLFIENHRYPHNSMLGIAAELGVIGFVIIALMGWCIYSGLRHWSWPIGFLFLMILMPALSFHDGQSIRMILILLALGYSSHSLQYSGK